MKVLRSKFQIPVTHHRNWVFGILLFNTVASAQYAFVNSKDGFADVRTAASQTASLEARLPNGTIVFAFDSDAKNGWIPIDFGDIDSNSSGFIGKSAIVPISRLTPILYSYSNQHKTILKANDISIVVADVAFDKTKAKLTFHKNDPKILEKIDGQRFFGADGNVPKRRYGFLDVTIGPEKIAIPASALEGLYEPNLENTEAFYDDKNDILYISSTNGDGAGGYEVLWVIEKRRYKTRHVFYGF